MYNGSELMTNSQASRADGSTVTMAAYHIVTSYTNTAIAFKYLFESWIKQHQHIHHVRVHTLNKLVKT